MSEEVKLYGTWASPYSRRVELALRIKGVQYEYIEEDLKNKSPQLLKYNPVHKKIPVLIHNGKPIAESLVILEYIDDTWPNPPLLPKEPYDRATVRFWAKFVDETILPTLVRSARAKDQEEYEQTTEEAREHLKFLEKELTGRGYFGGKAIGYLDVVVFYLIYYLQVSKEVPGRLEVTNEETFPHLHELLEKLLKMDVVKECLPPREKHIAYMTFQFEQAKAKAAALK